MRNETQTVCVIGYRGSGKTHLIKYTLIQEFDLPVIVFDNNSEFEDYPGLAEPENLHDFLDLVELGDSMRLDPKKFDFEEICYVLNEVRQPYLVVVDEFHLLQRHHMQFKADSKSFKDLFLLGNHNHVSMIVASQRPTDLPKFVVSQCTTMYCFYTWNKADFEHLRDAVEDPEQFKKLERYHFTRIDFQTPIQVTQGSTSA